MAIEEVKSTIRKVQDDMKKYYDNKELQLWCSNLATKSSSTHRTSGLRALCRNFCIDDWAPL